MIDNPAHVARLCERIGAALPLAASLTPAAAQAMGVEGHCRVLSVSYAGDDGGLMCTIPRADGTHAPLPITLLRFDPRHPLTREIALYQKRRAKRIRRQG